MSVQWGCILCRGEILHQHRIRHLKFKCYPDKSPREAVCSSSWRHLSVECGDTSQWVFAPWLSLCLLHFWFLAASERCGSWIVVLGPLRSLGDTQQEHQPMEVPSRSHSLFAPTWGFHSLNGVTDSLHCLNDYSTLLYWQAFTVNA